MLEGKRSSENPILLPDPGSAWESEAVYNPSPVVCEGEVHLLYRATGKAAEGQPEISSIGVATGKDGVRFKERRQLIVQEHPWEQLGCEDPRATAFEGRFYIFYTAIEAFSADGIRTLCLGRHTRFSGMVLRWPRSLNAALHAGLRR